MKKKLSQIDYFYATMQKEVSVSARVQYCSSLIYRTEGFVTRNIQKLSQQLKKKSFEIIVAAEQEMELLNNLKKSSS